MVYIGIDPGKNGGMARIRVDDDGNVDFIEVFPYSDTTLLGVLKATSFDYPIRCVLEKVNAMPGQGVTSMFHFGENFGFIQGVLRANMIPYELVPPQKWKKEFSVTSDKNTSIEVAKRLFPNVNLRATERCKKEHDGMCEALLMAEYARRHL
jgi:crossover junction endodeoxyribonuclease RuvC